MRNWCVALGVALVTAWSVEGKAIMIAPPPVGQRLINTDTVVVGKVTSIEEKTVGASPWPGAPKATYKVAVVKIGEDIKGMKGLTSIRVGFVPSIAVPAPEGPRIRPVRPMPAVSLVVGQEAIFFLKKHHDQDFYVPPMYFDIVNKEGNANFDKDVAMLKKAAKVLQNPTESLKVKDMDDRVMAAGLLVLGYRVPQGTGPQKFAPIDAEQSKLIVQTLIDADWSKRGTPGEMTPLAIFNRMVLPEDGFKAGPFKNYAEEMPIAAKKWLKDNVETFRVKKFVADETKK
jgi:hypothetical protein